jgi:hypothetical protein
MTMNDDLYILICDLSELDSELAILNKQRDELRARISELVEAQGGKVVLPGIARAEIRAPVILEAFDKDALLELMTSLSQTGYGFIADEINGCKKKSVRAGSLFVVMERKVKA